ncbi:DUF7808 domain-containing protein [Caenorhabditis elegans]|uniref:Secreted protein n=1 Tax=Caenorhabditis elegans TaxID=6239 RepID=Q7YWP9_CAEEL|nr:Secreted protein [Caenorhabditis elegans]CAE18008.2 Secreted protein [Caenorhabditis elegans]|eukprot:NP_001024289.2 Uncharacterized protein CELE_Y75B12B.11 [Caenorhabditis elegans]
MNRIYYLLSLLIFLNTINSLYQWENRILKCENANCSLQKTGEEFKPAVCEKDSNGKIACDIECDKADRDSVISKRPTDYRYCNRFYTYNAEKTSDGKYVIWRSGKCAEANITLSVHCAFAVYMV